MKKLTDMQKTFIINSALNAGRTMEEAQKKVEQKEIEINKPKKESFDWSSFNESDDGMM